jgi:NAD(P)-dependent dehydrogenase (short-subunit alcohol dehydrogenase family)
MATNVETRWTAADIPDLTGRVAVVTGANTGLGLEIARELASSGAGVVLACRSPERAERARSDISRAAAADRIFVEHLDLASLASVREFAERVLDVHDGIDLLINNAGVMALPRRETADGFEMQLGTNHLGHFALTGLLLPGLLARPGARIVTMSSTAHHLGRIDWEDLQGHRRYRRWRAYGQSKLANTLFAFELSRRLTTRGADCLSLVAHPGFAATELQLRGPRMDRSGWRERLWEHVNRLFAQSAAMGALPALHAATAETVRSGEFYGPDGLTGAFGHPTRVEGSASSKRVEDAVRLWAISEKLTGVHYLE